MTDDSKAEERADERLVFFSDAVYAIAITLLALDVRLPPLGSGPVEEELARALRETFPNFLAYVLSFTVIGLYWWHAVRAGLVNTDARESRFVMRRVALIPAVFLVSIPIAFISPVLAQLSWILLLFQRWLVPERHVA